LVFHHERLAILQVFRKYRRSGSNRHDALASPDFESDSLDLPTFAVVKKMGRLG
jgi:hypothetical protein